MTSEKEQSVTALEALAHLRQDNFVSSEDEKSLMAGLVVYGIIYLGNDKRAVKDWISESFRMNLSRRKIFGECWKNLEDNKILQKGLVYLEVLPEDSNFGVQFALLINVALGYIIRTFEETEE